MNRATTRLATACAIGLALLATGCAGSDTAGTPKPVDVDRPASPSAPTISSSVREASALTDLAPCDLLTSDDVGRLGLRHPGKEDSVGGIKTCNWYGTGDGAASAGIHPDDGADDLNLDGEHTATTKIGEYDAIRVEAPANAKYVCYVVISTSATSSVQVIGTVKATSTDTSAACERATKAAELIAPKLP
ncbi:DUF3558 domain-containing protein [Actinosynnema sp. NPDC059335]|uniref:DUF3558 domain-containing protein n=1 Tax=Actinosynnema sp. NPDC059335 TaxID=3346804 RepID=UPI00366D5181